MNFLIQIASSVTSAFMRLFGMKPKNTLPPAEQVTAMAKNPPTNRQLASPEPHGVTAEHIHQIIIENSDKKIVSEIMRLQGNKDKINKQLTAPALTPEKRQKLEKTLARTTQAHKEKWGEIINSPDKDHLMTKIEQAQLKQLQKQQARDHAHDHDRTR